MKINCVHCGADVCHKLNVFFKPEVENNEE